jgi:hypothetical protein
MSVMQRGGLQVRLSYVRPDTADTGWDASPPPADAGQAVAALFRDHYLELVRLAVLMVGDVATAEDVAQDAFERLHRPGLRGDCRHAADQRQRRALHHLARAGRAGPDPGEVPVSTDLEGRLRAELKAAARQVRPEILRGLHEPGAARGRQRRTVRWLAPATAMLTVLAVLAGVRLSAGGSGELSPPGPGGMPQYYVSGADFPGLDHHDKIVVQASATGAVVSQLGLPTDQAVGGISAAASGRLFLVSVGPAGGNDPPGTTFWTVTVSPGGRVLYRHLPMKVPPRPAEGRAGDFALSPDGKLAAVVMEAESLGGGTFHRDLQIELISIPAERVVRAWSAPPGWYPPGALSWLHGDRSLAFNYVTTTEGHDGVAHFFHHVQVLDMARPGSSLAANSAPPPLRLPTRSFFIPAETEFQFAIAIAGGSQFLVWTELPLTGRRDNWALTLYDTRTGRPLRVLVNLSGLVQADPMSTSADPTGQHLLIGGYGTFTLPGQPRPSVRALPPAGQEVALLSNGQLTLRQVPSNDIGPLGTW